MPRDWFREFLLDLPAAVERSCDDGHPIRLHVDGPLPAADRRGARWVSS